MSQRCCPYTPEQGSVSLLTKWLSLDHLFLGSLSYLEKWMQHSRPILAQFAFVSWHLPSIQKLENIWNLVITYFLWPFLVSSVTDLLFGMFLGNFKQQQMQRYSDNVNPNNGWVTKYSQEHFRYQQLILPWYCLCIHAPILASYLIFQNPTVVFR